jgi:DNA-binding NarL/FixJ family response regulator
MSDTSNDLRVYIVEDSPVILGMLVTAVNSTGAKLIGSSDNAPQAIREVANLKPHLILIDMALRSGTGFDVLKALPESSYATTKIVLTNYATAEYRDHSFRLGATHFFDKSSEVELVMRLITEMAAQRLTPNAKGSATHAPKD